MIDSSPGIQRPQPLSSSPLVTPLPRLHKASRAARAQSRTESGTTARRPFFSQPEAETPTSPFAETARETIAPSVPISGSPPSVLANKPWLNAPRVDKEDTPTLAWDYSARGAPLAEAPQEELREDWGVTARGLAETPLEEPREDWGVAAHSLETPPAETEDSGGGADNWDKAWAAAWGGADAPVPAEPDGDRFWQSDPLEAPPGEPLEPLFRPSFDEPDRRPSLEARLESPAAHPEEWNSWHTPVEEVEDDYVQISPAAGGAGEIVLPNKARFSLVRLFNLEQEIDQLPGIRKAWVNIQDDDRVVITFDGGPGSMVRVRQYLMLAGEI